MGTRHIQKTPPVEVEIDCMNKVVTVLSSPGRQELYRFLDLRFNALEYMDDPKPVKKTREGIFESANGWKIVEAKS